MPLPATTGQLRSRISDMEIGDYIVGNYDDSKAEGSKYGIGQGSYTECPLTGLIPASFKAHYFYYIKVKKGILVSDRIVINTIAWDTINTAKMSQGRPIIMDGVTGVIRSLTGGVAFADASGNRVTTDQGYGAWPVNNEWDKYVVNFPTNMIQAEKSLNDVFHYINVVTWCQDTPSLSMPSAVNTARVGRGQSKIDGFGFNPSSLTSATLGCFRPVFEYKEGS